MRLLLFRAWLVAGVVTTASAATDGGKPNADIAARLDALHLKRDDRAALAEARRLADGAVAAAPGDYAVLWRAARVRFTESDVPSRSD